MDWTALVDTATKAIGGSNGAGGNVSPASGSRRKNSSTVLLNNTDEKEQLAAARAAIRARRSEQQRCDMGHRLLVPIFSCWQLEKNGCIPPLFYFSTLVQNGHEADAESEASVETNINNSEDDPKDHVSRLLDRISRLESQKSHLEDEVSSLREENLRLQEESQAASQQLKRFTEWFFQTIDKSA